MTISRLRAGLGILFAVVPLMAGAQAAQAQAAQACPEPVLRNLPARGTQQELVRFRLADMTAGSDYLVRVAGRERKTGVATADKVSRRFRMPNLGQDKQRIWVEVVVANDACENGPWKFAEKMTYEPAPVAEPPTAQPQPQPQPTPNPNPNTSPNPPVAPSPPAAPSLTSPAPKTRNSQPAVPAPTVKPTIPTAPSEPPRDGRAWVTPADPSQKQSDPPLKATKGALARTELPSDDANSTAALLGLAGFFMVLVGIATIGWTRFHRYDNQRLDEILNPEGKLPTHLDPKAKDAVDEASVPRFRIPKFARKSAAQTAAAATAGAAAGAGVVAAAGEPKDRKARRAEKRAEREAQREAKKAAKTPGRRGGQGKGAMGQLTAEQKAAMSDEEKEAFQHEWKKQKRVAARKKKKAPLPTFDPTAPDAPDGPAVPAYGPMAKSPSRKPKKERRLLRRGKQSPAPEAAPPAGPDEPAAPASATPPPAAPRPEPAAPEVAAPRTVAPDAAQVPPAAPANGVPANGVPANGVPAQPANGQPGQRGSYRAEVESELQRILNDAGLHAEVDGILADAKAEAERQGVPIDSELMLQALCEETNGAAKLSDTAKGELESRFKRIVAEERGEGRPTPGS